MPRYQKRIWSGDVYEVEEYFSPRVIGKNYYRGKNESLTSEEQEKINLMNARKKLTRLINANFTPEDFFLTLTFSEKTDYEESKKILKKFVRKYKAYLKKKNVELKYVAVTEASNYHHHLVVTGSDISLSDLRRMWGQGRIHVSALISDDQYTGLANYITKETPEENRKRWSGSRNLTQPKIEVVEMKSRKPEKNLRLPKGYRLIYANEYYSEATGAIRYMKALRVGGMDLATKEVKKE